MIAHIQGKLVEKTPTEVVIDCNGVGYHVNISLHTFSLLPNTDFIKLFTHLQIKEDAHSLFGFVEKSERELFKMLPLSKFYFNEKVNLFYYSNQQYFKCPMLSENFSWGWSCITFKIR